MSQSDKGKKAPPDYEQLSRSGFNPVTAPFRQHDQPVARNPEQRQCAIYFSWLRPLRFRPVYQAMSRSMPVTALRGNRHWSDIPVAGKVFGLDRAAVAVTFLQTLPVKRPRSA
jgi:hypothetical protein